MTAQKHLKQLIRTRMQKTGERYASARRQVIGQIQLDNPDPLTRWHFPGNVPATTALRILLTHHGLRVPHTEQPFTEAMLFGIAGGIGIGVFQFYYQKEDHASFFIAGRHQWHDDAAYLQDALKLFNVKTTTQETAGAKAAEQQLRAALRHGPSIVWVDAAELPHRAMPAEASGGGYHVIVVYRINDEDNTALIGDLTDAPITGGGLCRPLFAEFLNEAGAALGDKKLIALAEQYAALGRQWSELAEAALPDDVPLMREAKAAYVRRHELLHDGAPVEAVRVAWQHIGDLSQQARAQFPLTEEDCAALRAQLQPRVLALYEAEAAAHAAIAKVFA
jgi:hypothetical protein